MTTSPVGSSGLLSSYTFATAKQATAVRSALDTATKSASHQNALKALNTLTGATPAAAQTAGNKALATLSGATTTTAQASANKALITMTALVNATDATQKLIAAKASSSYGAASTTAYQSGGVNLSFLT